MIRDNSLSVVIIGRNEGRRLASCLHSVERIRGLVGPIEVIYVDSASSDGSPYTALAAGAQVIVLAAGVRSAARGRNAGWQRATSSWVLFLDGDTIVDPDFPAAALHRLAAAPRIAAVWGHRRELHPQNSLYNRVADLDWIYPAGDTDFCGGDVLMRRSALLEVAGYDAGLYAGEEPELCRRLRARDWRIVHIDKAMTLHDLNLRRFRQYWQRAVRAGYAYAEVSARFRYTPDPMWSHESRRNLKTGLFWMGWLAGILVVAVWARWWVIPWLAVLPALAARTAWKARAKAPGQGTLLFLYGIHSHLQQIPILCGQWKYSLERRRQKPQSQIDYKEGANA